MFTLPTYLYNSIIAAGEDPALWPPLGGWGAAISFGDPFADSQFQALEITSFTETSVNEGQNLISTPVQATSLDITSAQTQLKVDSAKAAQLLVNSDKSTTTTTSTQSTKATNN